ncbi:MAG: hypothetical protein JEZ07_18205 [Phycisphaerae bacterium]|nr:hypothetical protein [Phycisphaerae bacterium]
MIAPTRLMVGAFIVPAALCLRLGKVVAHLTRLDISLYFLNEYFGHEPDVAQIMLKEFIKIIQIVLMKMEFTMN